MIVEGKGKITAAAKLVGRARVVAIGKGTVRGTSTMTARGEAVDPLQGMSFEMSGNVLYRRRS